MEKEKTEPGEFKVVDKRRFTQSGEEAAREDAARQETAQREMKVEDASASGAPVGQTTKPVEVDFPNFVVSLATQALMMMGEIPNPETRLTSVNMEAARQTIDILAMLEDKTRGNLSQEEVGLLEEVLSSVRMAYVRKVGDKKK